MHPPVVFARVHLRVLHSELLGKQHECIHWPLALSGCGAAASLCTEQLVFGGLLLGGVGMTGTVHICGFKTGFT